MWLSADILSCRQVGGTACCGKIVRRSPSTVPTLGASYVQSRRILDSVAFAAPAIIRMRFADDFPRAVVEIVLSAYRSRAFFEACIIAPRPETAAGPWIPAFWPWDGVAVRARLASPISHLGAVRIDVAMLAHVRFWHLGS